MTEAVGWQDFGCSGSCNWVRTQLGFGFTRVMVPANTVGTVSSPPVTLRTRAEAAGSLETSIHTARLPARPKAIRRRMQ